MSNSQNVIEIFGAREHNLKNLDLSIPREKLVVITGLSGSGKSSLAFDTLYAEGQRRYIETFSAYARQFLGNLERPDVDAIEGLSPVIAIEQKTTNKNPRSTVGTVTEIYDFFRLLFARAATAYSYETGEKMISYQDDEITQLILSEYTGQKIILLAPVIRSRKGHYRELFEQIAKQGFIKVRIDGEIKNLERGMKVDRYKTHDIEIVIDRLSVSTDENERKRLEDSIKTALHYGENTLMMLEHPSEKIRYFSRNFMCPTTGIAYPEPEPNTFSFNSPKGACPVCNGLGEKQEVNLNKIIPDTDKSIKNGGIAPVGEYKSTWIFKQLELIAERYGFKITTPIKDIPKEGLDVVLYGSKEQFSVASKTLGITRHYKIDFEGIVNFIKSQSDAAPSAVISRWAAEYMDVVPCPECEGARLKKESGYFKIDGKNISDLSRMDIEELAEWLKNSRTYFDEKQWKIAEEIIKELKQRVSFLLGVGLSYLSLHRTSQSLSGGEAQRIRLATQIGTQLVGVLYILDEPSIGLHQRDNQKLIEALKTLRDVGNSVLVVEHDKDMMLQADYIIDMGPAPASWADKSSAKVRLRKYLKAQRRRLNIYRARNK